MRRRYIAASRRYFLKNLLYFANMKYLKTAPLLFALFVLASCGNEEKAPATSDNHVDAVRNFVRAALDGKFAEARMYMISDSVNNNYMDVAERSYANMTQENKDGYRASSIQFPSPMVTLNDSTSIVIYSNSFKNNPDTLKVMKTRGKWLVDFKYLYLHDADTINSKAPKP
jgi:hypothetical protein